MFKIHFTKQGNILQEEGVRPNYFNDLLEDLRNNKNKNEFFVRNDFVKVKQTESDIFIEIYNKNTYNKVNDNKNTSNKENTIKKSRNWKGDIKNLDYSDNTIQNDNDIDLLKNNSSLSNFKNIFLNLFNKKKELNIFDKKIITEHFLQKNVSLPTINFLLKNINSISELKNKIKFLLQKKEILIKNKPFKIALIGPNGVGKSTTLSKLCLFFLKKKYSILIAACDTFRSGAIEQLKIYINRLKKIGKIDLYFEGYNKEESFVAKNSFKKSNNYDILIVDTAGRTSSLFLMNNLKKLINLKFDEVIFINEALKGNFNNSCFKELITGIIVTKLDTVSDKVGSILNFCYELDKPIFFTCNGQSNVDMQELDVENVIEQLFLINK